MSDLDYAMPDAAEEPILQDKSEVFTPEALEATARADAALEAWDNQAQAIEENWGTTAEETVSTPDVSEANVASETAVGDVNVDDSLAAWDAVETTEPTPDIPAEPEVPETPDQPDPGDLDWDPSDTGVGYPDPERKEGNPGGPESLG